MKHNGLLELIHIRMSYFILWLIMVIGGNATKIGDKKYAKFNSNSCHEPIWGKITIIFCYNYVITTFLAFT